MFCGKCGSAIPDGNSFCANCGAPIPDLSDLNSAQSYSQPVQPVPVIIATQALPEKRTNGMAIAGLILGIIAFLFCLVPVIGFVLGIVGLILSIIGINKKKTCKSGGGLAITGLILSIIGIMGFTLALGTKAYIEKQEAYASESANNKYTSSTGSYYNSTSSTESYDEINAEIERILG